MHNGEPIKSQQTADGKGVAHFFSLCLLSHTSDVCTNEEDMMSYGLAIWQKTLLTSVTFCA